MKYLCDNCSPKICCVNRFENKKTECDSYVPMNNEQFIRFCDTEQLAEWIAKQKCDGCNDEPYDEKHGTCKYCMAKKMEQIREWLKQPHTFE